MGRIGAQALERHPNWKGGRTVRNDGYVLVKQPGHPRANPRGYVYEHILVAEEMLGRALHKGEEVHHEDRNPSNNEPSNLIVKASRAEHLFEHRRNPLRANYRLPSEPNPEIACACGCGEVVLRFSKEGRPRRYKHGHNPVVGRFGIEARS